MFGLGTQELLIIGVVVLLLFGNRLPSVMRSLGRGVVEFKKGVAGIEDDLQQSSQQKPKVQSSNIPPVEPQPATHSDHDKAAAESTRTDA